MHRGNVLDDEILGQCKKIFNDLHGAETAKVIKQLSALRLQKQVTLLYISFTITYTITHMK